MNSLNKSIIAISFIFSSLTVMAAAQLEGKQGGFDPAPVEVFERAFPDKTGHVAMGRVHLEKVLFYVIFENFYKGLPNLEMIKKKSAAIADMNPRVRKLSNKVFEQSKSPDMFQEWSPLEAHTLGIEFCQRILNKIRIFSFTNKELHHRLLFQEEKDALLSQVFSFEYFGISEPAQRVRSPEPKFIREPFEFTLNDKRIFDVYQAALRIVVNSKQGDVLVALGNTPYFIYRALSHLVAQDPSHPDYRRLIIFPFSGAPNRSRSELPIEPKDIVTRTRLEHLRARMVEAGITPQNMVGHTTYIIDCIYTGSGPAYIMHPKFRTTS